MTYRWVAFWLIAVFVNFFGYSAGAWLVSEPDDLFVLAGVVVFTAVLFFDIYVFRKVTQ